MALCPACQSPKPFFAPRCSNCNSNISFLNQLFGMIIYWTVVFGGFYLMIRYGLGYFFG
jgi:hypothetical protein